MSLRARYPLTYSNNLKLNSAPLDKIGPGMFGWAKASWSASTPEVMENVGLDQAMLLEFCNLAMRIMVMIGFPMLCIMGPVNYVYGGDAAGEDHLSYLSFGNVVEGSQLYWIHACIVWGVVFTVQVSLYAAQRNFLRYRFQWLKELPKLRAHTVLVEGIPYEYQSAAKLKEFFTEMFGANKIASTYMVKKHAELETTWAAREANTTVLEKARFQEDLGKVAALEAEGSLLDTAVEQLQSDVKIKSWERGGKGYNTSTGFVSFADKTDVALALHLQFGEHLDNWEVSVPPQPQSILWNDLKQSSAARSSLTSFGYILTAALFMAYMPAVVGITQIAVKVNMGPLQPLWAGLAPTVGLQVMVAFLPTFLILIFRLCFTLKDDAWAQQMLQNWYFIFQVVFVILVTALGGSMMEFLDTLVQRPLKIFSMLAKTMPSATHFYMNFLVLQWASHAMVLMRYVPLAKWFMFRGAGYDDETSRQMSEPEDQDYYGIGSRSARMTINVCIGVIFGTLSPPINLLTFIEFCICRLVYGYLIPFAETKKPDLGGVFWVQSLRHIFVGNIIYCVVMIGVLLGRAATCGPGILATPSLFYVIYSMKKFERSFCWEKLPFEQLKADWGQGGGTSKHQKKAVGEYVQPWMKAILDQEEKEAALPTVPVKTKSRGFHLSPRLCIGTICTTGPGATPALDRT